MNGGRCVMDERNEWCFEFHISALRSIRRAQADNLFDEVILWAEGHRLGVGGGYRPASPEVSFAALSWAFHFGLCATEQGQLIPERQAKELWELLRAEGQWQGFWCDGGVRAFKADELVDKQS